MIEEKFENVVTLVVGDWSDDGHGKTEHVTITCNLTKKQLEEAYGRGVKVCGVDVEDEVCCDYECRSIPKELVDKLVAHGLKPDDFFYVEGDDEEPEYFLDIDSFVSLWLFVAKLGDPRLEWRNADSPTINVGGYGLFD